ncbi:protein kinase domain-containing protein [Paracoccus sp. Ld10]|uniref:serine/threonine-protein kinase n=1 Tax=Paracoccus sp. Ld10 TaxID=649158 RepID=UPI0038636261
MEVSPDPSDAPAERTVIGTAPEFLPGARPPDATVLGDAVPDFGPGDRILDAGTLINNNYRITGLVSSGGMGEVYRAENAFTGDPVAVKVVLPDLADDPAVLDLFRREARVLVQLRDETIVRYHNFVLDGGLQRYCLIMEFVEGRHLGARMKEDGPLNDTAALALMRRLAGGLARAHAHGVTHRDLSPDNVILRDDHLDEPVLIDFGIARSTELGDGLAGRFAGKFKYIAPEQLGHWQGEIGPWTDVYGLALLIAAAARGSALPMGDNVVSASAARQVIPDLGGLSHRLFPVLQQMLEPDPARRLRDMGAVLRMLDDPMALPAQYRLPLWSAAAGQDLPNTTASSGDAARTGSISPFAALAASSATDASEPPPAPGRCPWVPIAGLASLLIMAAAGFWWLSTPGPDPEAPTEVATALSTMQPRDPDTREGFLADQPLPTCTFVTRIAQGPDAGRLLAVSDSAVDLTPLAAAYGTRFGAAPSILSRRIASAQCPALDFLRQIAGRPARPPLLEATSIVEATGFQIRGRALAGAEGRSLWLFLLAPDGKVYDLSAQISANDDGGFAVAVQLPEDATRDASYLLVGLGVEDPLASVTAAPSGADAADLLPRVLAELNATSAAPAAGLIVLMPGAGQAE